jgi:hypothetical protein
MVDTVMLDAPDLVEEVEDVSMLDVEMVDLVVDTDMVDIDMVDAVSYFLFSLFPWQPLTRWLLLAPARGAAPLPGLFGPSVPCSVSLFPFCVDRSRRHRHGVGAAIACHCRSK